MKRFMSIVAALVMIFSISTEAVSSSYSGAPREKQWTIKPRFDQAIRFKNGFARVRKDGKWGYIDKTGKLVIPCQFEYADDFYDGIAFVGNSSAGDGKVGVIDTTGKLIIPYKYDRYEYTDGYIRATEDKLYFEVVENGKSGYVTSDGEILKCIYDDVEGISEDRIKIMKDRLYGFADLNGNEIVPCQYTFAYDYVNGYSVVEKLENSVVRAGVIDKNGKVVIPFDYRTVTDFREGNFYAVTPEGQVKLLNTQGQIVDSIDYYYNARIMPYFRNIAMLDNYDGTSEVFDMKGNHITELSPETIDAACDSNDSNQIMSIEKDNKYGFVNGKGELITDVKYSWISDNFYFRERNGIIRVATADEGKGLKMKNGKFGFINKEGKEVVPCKYGYACFYGFINGVARVADGGSFTDPDDLMPGYSEEMNGHLTDLYTGGKWGYIDTSGREIVPLKYDKTEPFVNYMGRVRLGSKYGLVNQQGEEVVPCIYDYVSYFSNGLALVSGGQFVDQWGKFVELPDFDSADNDTAEGLICAELDRKYGYLKNPLPAAELVTGNVTQGETSSTKYLTLSCGTPDADIYYSYEGGPMESLASPSLPNREDLEYVKYKEPILIDRLTTVRAYSVKKGMQNSEVQSFTIDVKYEALAGVQSSLASGSYTKGEKVVLTSDKKDATIYYTVDGTDPTYKSPMYNGPIELKQTVKIKTFAVRRGMLDSKVNTFTYTVN